MIPKPQWELVCEESDHFGETRTCRLQVAGGWLYRCQSSKGVGPTRTETTTVCFVDDPIREVNDPRQIDFRVFGRDGRR